MGWDEYADGMHHYSLYPLYSTSSTSILMEGRAITIILSTIPRPLDTSYLRIWGLYHPGYHQNEHIPGMGIAPETPVMRGMRGVLRAIMRGMIIMILPITTPSIYRPMVHTMDTGMHAYHILCTIPRPLISGVWIGTHPSGCHPQNLRIPSPDIWRVSISLDPCYEG